MKPGYLTTEFWLTVIVGFLTNLGTIEVPDKYKWLVNVALVLGYALSRGLAKYESPSGSLILGSVDPAATEEAEQREAIAAAKPKPRSTRKKAS